MIRTLALLGMLGLAQVAHAAYHFAVIDEAYLGLDGDPTGQFLEIRMLLPLQTNPQHTVLTTFSCDGTTTNDLAVIPSNITNSGTNLRWLMATGTDGAFFTQFGVHADFYVTGSFPLPCGQVCWGAPPVNFLPPADPASWSHTDPNNFVDCIAYGGYTGTTKTTGQLPTTGSVAGGKSFTREASDFAPACPTPTNNDSVMGAASGCVSPTTTTSTTTTVTTTTSTTSSTTLPTITGQALTGKQLSLKVKVGKPQKSRATVLSADTTLSLGGGNASVDDPTGHGGSLRLAGSADGALFDQTYQLPTSGWKVVGKFGKNKGYKWSGTVSQGPAATVLVKPAKQLKVSIHGTGLALNLSSTPNPVVATLTIGTRRYCLLFGGTVKFKANASYSAKGALAPPACP